jgi:hypothetical protein
MQLTGKHSGKRVCYVGVRLLPEKECRNKAEWLEEKWK